jgi:hypothetical protein
MPLNSELYL